MPIEPNKPDKRLKDIQRAIEKLREELAQIEGQTTGTATGGAGSGGITGAGAGAGGGVGGLIQSGGGDFIAPSLGLTVTPDGKIRYEFEGRVFADGVTLSEALSGTLPLPENSVQWLDDAEIERQIIQAYRLAAGVEQFLHAMQLTVIGENPEGNEEAATFLLSVNPNPLASPRSHISISLAGNLRTLLTDTAASSFLQLPPGEGGATNPLHRVVAHGRVNGESGNVATGEGATGERIGTGLYRLIWDNELNITPSIVVTPIGLAIASRWRLTSESKTSAEIAFENSSGSLVNPNAFTFHAIG